MVFISLCFSVLFSPFSWTARNFTLFGFSFLFPFFFFFGLSCSFLYHPPFGSLSLLPLPQPQPSPSPSLAGKSTFCLQIQSHKVRLKRSVGWLLFYMQLKIFTDCDENNCKQDRCPQWCGFCLFFKKLRWVSSISLGRYLIYDHGWASLSVLPETKLKFQSG